MIDFKTIPQRYQRYYTYLEPVFADPLIRGYFSLIASFLLVAFFVIFALSPTINTILALNKKIADQKKTITALDSKITALISAQQNYSRVENLIPLLDIALPGKPSPQTVVSQILETASSSAVTPSGLQFRAINLLTEQAVPPPVPEDLASLVPASLSPLPFSLAANGEKGAVLSYLSKLENSLRYMRFQIIGLSPSEDGLTVGVDAVGLGYYYVGK